MESRDRLRRLATRMTRVLENERTSIARRVHDELGQLLTLAKLDAVWLGEKLGPHDEEVESRGRELLECLDKGVAVARRIARQLRPGALDELGLRTALETELDDFAKRSGIPCRFEAEPDFAAPGDPVDIALFRVFQEALTNVTRHAHARKVDVQFWESDGKLHLSIHDDGVGISKEQMAEPSSLGIIGMQERIQAIGGKLRIEGSPRKGTRVEIDVPLEVNT